MLSKPVDLISRVRRGEINFERFVEILRSTGVITEQHQENGCGFGSSAMEAVRQEAFEAIFAFFYPDELCDIRVECAATSEGGEAVGYAYALFNSNVVTREEVLNTLRAENEKTYAWLQGKA